MITLKEKKMLLKMKSAMGEDVAELQAEIEAEEKKLQEQSESRKSAFNNIFADLSKNLNELAVQDKKRSKDQQTLVDQLGMLFNKMAIDPQVPQEIKEEFVKIDEAPEEVNEPVAEQEVIEQPKPLTSVDRVVAHVKETASPSMFVQPNPPTVDKDIKAIQNKLKLLEGWVGKISMTGPGGGAVWLRDLDDIARASVMSASDGDVLKYNASTKKWEAGAVSANGVVGTLHQVTTAGNTTNNSITANGVHSTHFAANLTSGYTVSTGEIAWNAADLTFDMGMASGVTLQVGQEQFIRVKAANTITNGQTVMFAGANGENVLALPCNMSVPGFRPEWFIGIATHDIAKNGFGYITTFGKVHDVNTLAWTEGDILYADPTVIGGLTNVEPDNINIMVAAVTKRAGGDGHILVRPSWRFYLDEINGVTITSPANGQVLTYISSSNTWVNHSIDVPRADNTSILQAANGQLSFNANNALFMYQTTDGGSGNLLRLYGYSGESLEFTTGSSNGVLSVDAVNHGAANYANLSFNGKSVKINSGSLGGQGTWTFSNTTLTFPDTTTQTTAWTGSVSTLTANNTAYVGSVTAANVVSNTQLQSNLANYQTTAGLSANVATLSSNNASYLGTVAAASYVQNTDSRTLSGNLSFTAANNKFTQDLTVAGNFYVGANTRAVRTVVSLNTLTGYYSGVQVARADSEQWFVGADTSDKFVIRRNATADDVSIDNSTGLVTIGSLTVSNTITGNISGTSNNTSFVGSTSAANVVSNTQLQSNLANYQTTAGLSANVATLTANNTSFVGSVSAANVVSNTQLSSNLANYQTTAGLSANVAKLSANNSAYLGDVAAASYAVLGANANFANVSAAGIVTANAATAFIAGDAAISGVALQMPHEGALRNMSTTSSTMYFDVNNGGAAHGYFNFRSSNNFTSIVHLGVSQVTFNSGAAISGQTPYAGRTSFNVALDTVVTVDSLKYRISNQGGVFPQIASASGSTVDVCYDVEGIVSGTTNPTWAQNSGYILLADGTWLSIYSSHGMDSRGDRLTAHITDKNAGKIYRVTYMKTNDNTNTDGYNIIVERII